MSESNICEICGGVKNLVYITEAIPKSATALTVTSVSAPPSKPWGHLCYGHPKGAPQHDGKLDEDGRFKVAFDRARMNNLLYVRIEGIYDDEVCMTAKQAISLLSWLEQNRAELTALAEDK